MLNISQKSISAKIDKSQYKSFQKLERKKSSKLIIKLLLIVFLIFVITMFLPWTQNIRSKGKVTTLNPYDKPQNIQAVIGGKIDSWLVTEGDIVSIGDTIVILAEAKAEYLDPDLLSNTKDQQDAKVRSADAYRSKLNYLESQLKALSNNRRSKLEQIEIKRAQIELEIRSTLLDIEAAITYLENATKQLERMEIMYEKGIKSLTDLESKRLSIREASAKKTSYDNKLSKLNNDLNGLEQAIDVANADYDQKFAKIESEIQSTASYRYSLIGETSKQQSKFNQIEQRQNAFVITSPINGRITKVLKNGIGEIVKAQENIATIVPTSFQKAVELYIRPNDMPLISEGKKVRLQFDGWPAMVFSGWPDNSFGTFGGEVYAVDNNISDNGKYRILVIEDSTEKSWPELIRIGSGAQGLLLLNDVRVYYELWRNLNGFPPDFYTPQENKSVKNKAPIRKIK